MSDNEVIVTIEPELLDFETTHKAPGDVGNSKPSRLPPAELTNGHKIRRFTVLRLALSRAGAGRRQMYSRAMGTARRDSVPSAVQRAGGWSSHVEVGEVSANLKAGHPAACLINPKEDPATPVVDGKRVLP
jgi:hypothetical protein